MPCTRFLSRSPTRPSGKSRNYSSPLFMHLTSCTPLIEGSISEGKILKSFMFQSENAKNPSSILASEAPKELASPITVVSLYRSRTWGSISQNIRHSFIGLLSLLQLILSLESMPHLLPQVHSWRSSAENSSITFVGLSSDWL